MLRPRPPGHLLGAEERDAADAQRRGEVADTRVVADVGGRVAQNTRKQRERWLPEHDRVRDQWLREPRDGLRVRGPLMDDDGQAG